MSNICEFDLNDFLSDVSNKVADDTLSNNELLKGITKSATEHSLGEENIQEASSQIYEMISDYGLSISEEEIKRALEDSLNPPSIDDVGDQTSDSLDKDSMYIENKEIYSKSLKIEAFDGNTAAFNYYNKVVTDMVISTMIWNREKIIATDQDVNLEINKYQEKLYQQLLNYLQQVTDVEGLPETLYTDNFTKYTEALEILKGKYGDWFNTQRFNNSTLQSKFLSLNILGNDEKQKVQTEIDGYNAWVILNNFDSTIKAKFGNSIAVDNTLSPFTPANSSQSVKYSLANAKASNMNTTWRTSEDIDITKEINNIVQLIVEYIPLQGSGRNLKFSEFGYALIKLKKLAEADINLNDLSYGQKTKLSQNTQDVINESPTITKLIANIRVNPQKYIPALFEIFSNQDIRDSLIDDNYFQNQDIAIIESIYKGLFDSSDVSSLVSAQKKQGYTSHNFLGYVTEAADSISSANYLQYFRNSEGEVYARNMYDQTIDNIIRDLTDQFTISNSRLVQSFQKFSKKVSANTNANGKLLYITYRLGDDIYLKVEPVRVSLIKGEDAISYAQTTEADRKSIKEFIDQILHQNLINNSEYWNNLIVVGGNRAATSEVDREQAVVDDLLTLSGHILFNEYISSNLLTNNTGIDTILDQIYGSDSTYKPKYNNQLEEINLTSLGDFYIIQKIAMAKAITTGRLTAAVLKDGNNKSLPSSSLSRLLGNIWTQVTNQIQQPNSVAKHFILFNPKVLVGIYQSREFKDFSSSQATDHKEFTAGEMMTAQLLYDFVGGLKHNNNTRSPLGRGKVAFYPAVYSDKSYIGRVIIDLNNIIVNGRSIASLFTESNGNISVNPEASGILDQLLYEQMGTYYANADAAAANVWDKIANIREQYGDPNSIYANTLISYKSGFYELNQAYDESDKSETPLQYISNIVRKYNEEHPEDIIQLVDHACYEQVDGFLKPNIELKILRDRYSATDNINRFFKNQEKHLIVKLLTSGFSGMPVARVGNTMINSIEDLYKLAGANIAMSPQDILQNLNNIVINPVIAAYNKINYFVTQEWLCGLVGGQFNHPGKANKYLGLTYIPQNADPTVQHMVQATQQIYKHGTIEGNPQFTDVLQEIITDEATRFVAQVKRNVSYTATQHAYQLNNLTGVPTKANVTVIPDNLTTIRTVNGTEIQVPTSDGATYVNPFMGEWENGSLGGAKVGVNKKQFIHAYDEILGVGAIIKTAGFTFTNETMRASLFDRTAMRYMTDRIWLDQDGDSITQNVLEDYNGNPIQWQNPQDVNRYVYIKQGDKFYQIVGINYLGNNIYQRILQEVSSKDGVVRKGNTFEDTPMQVQSNYDLWNLFGGFNCFEQLPGELSLTPSEASIKIVSDIANRVGQKLNPEVRTQEDLYQFMKHSDIHYMPTEGALKQYQTNMEDINDDLNEGKTGNRFLNYFKINLYQAGIQLDKEHNADEEDLSIFTQVISACAAMGYNTSKAQEMYEILATLAREATIELQDSYNAFLEYNDLKGFQNTVAKIVARAFMNQNSSSEAIAYTTTELLKLIRDGKQAFLKDAIPYSDAGIYSKIVSTIGSTLTKTAIKVKMAGVLAVLCPSYNRYKIYNGELLNGRTQEDLDNAQKAFEKPANDLMKNKNTINYDRSYKLYCNDFGGMLQYLASKGITNARIIDDYISWDINTTADYNLLKQLRDGTTPEQLSSQNMLTEIAAIKESPIEKKIDFLKQHPEIEPIETLDSFIGDRLAAKRINTDDLNTLLKENGINKSVQNYTRMHSKNGTKLDKFISETVKAWNKEHSDDSTDEQEIKDYLVDIFRNYSGQVQIANIGRLQALNFYQPPVIAQPTSIFENVAKGRNLAGYNVQFIGTDSQGNTQRYSLYDCDVIQKNIEAKHTVDRQETQVVLNALSKSHSEGMVMIGGKLITVDKNSIQINPAEIVLPKVFKTKFGLKNNDQLSDIINNPKFFTQRLLAQVKATIPENNFTVSLSTIGKNNTYILDRNQAVANDNFKRVVMATKTNSDGTVDRVNSEGKVLYTLSKTIDDINAGQKQDELWQYTDANGIVSEVIVTTDINHYLNNLPHNYIKLSPKISQETFNSISENIPDIVEEIGDKPLEKSINEINKAFNNPKSNDRFLKRIQREGAEIYTSFKKSLEIVAARIPAQSLQSVMTMKVAGFVDSDVNTAYVSATQTFLQGSDYDIDSVSLAMFDFNEGGKFIGWSPYFNLRNTQMLDASLTLPFPQAHAIPVADSTNEYDLTGLIQELGEINNNALLVETDKGWKLSLDAPEKIVALGNLIRHINKYGLSFTENYRGLNELLASVVNKHNYYVQNMKDSRKRESVIKNKLQQNIFDIVNNPSSQQEAQEGVDQVTKPFKKLASESPKAREEANNLPESFSTYVEALRNNQVGKKAVGISAVALKSYFALTQAYNKALETITQENILVGEVKIGDKVYRTLSNITCENPNQLAKQIIDYAKHDQDYALALSAFVSLSTDNAKDLALAKLNCGDNTMGMWLYGISLGVPATELMAIMTSPEALALTDELNGNVFTGKANKSFSQVFNYLMQGPINELGIDTNGVLNLCRALNISTADGFKDRLIAYLQGTKDLSSALSAINTVNISDALRTQLIHYLRLWTVCNINGTTSRFRDFVRLAKGSDEFRTIGQMLHINQGLETTQQDILNRISIVEDVITTREASRNSESYNNGYIAYYNQLYKAEILKAPGTETPQKPFRKKSQTSRINLHDFLYDPIYQKECIEEYNDVKEIFNPLYLITHVPHYYEYFKLLDTQDQAYYNCSVKYRTIKNLGMKTIDEVRARSATDKQKVIKRVSDYADTKLITSYFLNNNIVLQVTPSVVYINGKAQQNSSVTKLDLGTADGRATFKLWMESVVIPNLQRGFNGLTTFSEIQNNKFLQDLAPIVYDTTPTGKPVVAHSLSISMSPRNDSDQAIFDSYKGEFNKLANMGLKYFEGNYDYNISDLMFWYNLCVFQNKQNDSSLAKIFEDLRGNGTIKKYYDYISWMDNNSNILNPTGIEEYSIIPFDNPWSSTLKKFLYRNKRTNQIELWTKQEKLPVYDDDPGLDMADIDEYNMPSIIRGYQMSISPFANLQTFYYVIPQTNSGLENENISISQLTEENKEYGVIENGQLKKVPIQNMYISHIGERIQDIVINGQSIKDVEGYDAKHFSRIPIVYTLGPDNKMVAEYDLRQIVDDAITLMDKSC